MAYLSSAVVIILEIRDGHRGGQYQFPLGLDRDGADMGGLGRRSCGFIGRRVNAWGMAA